MGAQTATRDPQKGRKLKLLDVVFMELEIGVPRFHVEANPDEVVERCGDVFAAETPPWGHTIAKEDAGYEAWRHFGFLGNCRGRDKPHFAP